MKVAIVYDRVNKWGGAERVLLALHELFPKAPLYTSVYSPENASWAKVFPKIYTSFLNKVSFFRRHHELLSIFMPLAFESFNFDEYDLVISVSSEAAKGIITKPQTKHIDICLTPTRYLYSGISTYLKDPPGKLRTIPFFKIISTPFIKYIKHWDLIASSRPDELIAISSAVKKRIKKYYKKESILIYPPVDVAKFKRKSSYKPVEEEYYLIVGRLESYKKADLVIEAFKNMKKTLVVIGVGSNYEIFKSRYGNYKNIIFKGFVNDNELIGYYQNAQALIFPQDEDFGITPVEAQAAGCPVIAYKKGGALDTIIYGITGLFFSEQNTKSIIDKIGELEKIKLSKNDLIKNAQRFDAGNFKKEIIDLIHEKD